MIRIAATSKNPPQFNTCLSQLTTPAALRIMMDNTLLPGLALIDNMETAVRALCMYIHMYVYITCISVYHLYMCI